MKRNRKGYTLVEMVVVMAIVAILVAGSIISIFAYLRYAHFKKQNEYAQSLYTAAQLQLTSDSQLGQLEELIDLTEGRTVPLSSLTDGDGNAITSNLIWGTDETYYQGTLRYITATSSDYASYVDGTLEDETLLAFYDLFDSYLYDKSILSASICLELDPVDGLVYSVLYSDEADSFTYGADTGSAVSIADRTQTARKARMVGYYGADTLSKATSLDAEKPVISNVLLNNENTLNLSFRLSKVSEATSLLNYELVLYDAAGKTPLLSVAFNDANLKTGSLDAANYILVSADAQATHTIEARVTGYTPDGGTSDLGMYTFPAWIESDGTVRIVLDATDLGATAQAYEASSAGDAAALKHTFSLHRFGVDADTVYCTIQGSATNYKTTAKKESNAEQPYFGSYTESGSGVSYTLANARHLYNVRFSECEDATQGYTYTVSEQISWQALIDAGAVYLTQTSVSFNGMNWITDNNIYCNQFYNSDLLLSGNAGDVETAFPSIQALRANSVLQSVGEESVISDLNLRLARNNLDAITYSNGEYDISSATGLFLINRGTVRNVSFDNVTAVGESYTGIVCGVNSGSLSGVTVRNTTGNSSVSGTENVGGIFGGQLDADAVTLSGLENRASVTGSRYVGGIVGQLSAKDRSVISVTECLNYGKVSAIPDGQGRAYYIGGIAGYVCQEDKATLTVEACTSSPQYNASEVYQNGTLTATLCGTFVGGIAGLNEGATITNCNTDSENGVAGYVLGDDFVGGIVGYNLGTLDGQGGQNQANVIGNRYVGGIVGANANLVKNNLTDPEADTKQILKLAISDWINAGVVIAMDSYSGGIAGMNCGTLENCGSNVTYDATAQALSLLPEDADYVGGIAGYNNGAIQTENEETASVSSVVSGRNYIGGLIGWNGEDASVSGYRLQGGYISGDSFVGGFVGLNLASQLLDGTQAIQCNPNAVTGAYFVGGVLGGNIVRTANELDAKYQVYNILGNVTGTEFVGGFIGYNLLLQNGSAADVAQRLTEELSDSLSGNMRLLETVGNSVKQSNSVLKVEGTTVELRGITGDLFVGGVIGYNDEKTYLYINNVTNRTTITANDAVTDADSQVRYSYAGGVVGKIGETVIVNNCSNEGVGSVVSHGTYTGGIAELNCGLVVNCSSASGGNNTTSNIGGVIGLNAPKNDEIMFATAAFVKKEFDGAVFVHGGNKLALGVYSCALTGTITGNDNVGGIVSVNRGVIYAPVVKGSVTAYGQNAGGVVAKNESGGSVVLSATCQITVTGSASNAGGIAGENQGSLTIEDDSDASLLTVSGSISGSQNVGGVVGSNETAAQTLSGLVNGASVTATYGNAGGIAGQIADGVSQLMTVSDCVNQGSVQATQSGNAGGIIAYSPQNVTLQTCWDSGEVTAFNGTGGGIAGVNAGTLADCVVSGQTSAAQSSSAWTRLLAWLSGVFGGKETGSISMVGNETVGAVAGINTGSVTNCAARFVAVSNNSNSAGNGCIGGLVGYNSGTITLGEQPGVSLQVSSYVNQCDVGGIAGNNTGIIRSASGSSVIGTAGDSASFTVAFSGSATQGNLGGVAGTSNGAISGCGVYATITGDKGTSSAPENGYGGIVGMNSGSVTSSSFDGKIYANGTVSAVSAAGGICGQNLQNGLVEGCVIGKTDATQVLSGTANSAYSYLGGLVGWNQGIVRNCDNNALSAASVSITGYAGHVGGIVGFNDETGSVTGTDENSRLTSGSLWTVDAKYYSNDCGTGGIMGYSSSGSNMAYVSNYATVWNSSGQTGNSATGGIIGRLENKLLQGFRMDNCENYGEIWSSALSGGIIGRWKYLGGMLENCVNYGTIGVRPSTYSNKNQSSASAGLVASTYMITQAQYINLIDCENHGTINSSSTSAGIFGVTDNTKKVYVCLTDCVNTGSILSTGTSGNYAGIACNKSENVRFIITRCRNYGNGDTDALNYFSGIYNASKSNLAPNEITQCFDYSNSTLYPISNVAPADVEERNFYVYLGDEDLEGDSFITVDSSKSACTSASGAMAAESINFFKYTFDGNPTTRSAIQYSSKTQLSFSTNNPITMTYTLSGATDMAGFGLFWCNNGSTSTAGTGTCRQYVYKLYYVTADGSRVEVTTPDSCGNRNTYDAALSGAGQTGFYVENGYSKNDSTNLYYHALSSDGSTVSGVTQIQMEVYQINSLTGDANAAKAGDGAMWTKANTGVAVTTSAYICLWDAYATHSGVTAEQFRADPGLYYLTTPKTSAPSGDLAAIGLPVKSTQLSDGSYALQDANGLLTAVTGLTLNPVGTGEGTLLGGKPGSRVLFTEDFSTFEDYRTGDLASLTTNRYRLICEIDPRIRVSYEKNYLAAPQIRDIAVEDQGASFLVSWTSSVQPYRYEVSYAVGGVQLGDVVYTATATRAVIDAESDWANQQLTIAVRGIYFDASGNRCYTEWVSAQPVTVSSALPTPKVHLELTGTGDSNSYKVVLENPEDYVNVLGDTLDATISYTLSSGMSTSFRVSEGESKPVSVSSTGNLTITAQALANTLTQSQRSAYTDSAKRTTISRVFSAGTLNKTDYCITTFSGFGGTTVDGLYYQMMLKKANEDVETYYYSEVLAYDEELGCDVAVSYGESHVTGQGQEMTATLSGLPTDLTAQDGTVTVRTYPWRTQSYQSYFGHEVIASVSKAELKNVVDATVPIYADGAFAPGYVIQRNTDGSYRVIYSAILADEDYYQKQIDSQTYTVDLEHETMTSGSGKVQYYQAKPVIDEDYLYTASTDTYRFTWDTGLHATDAGYQVTLVGLAQDGSEVELGAVTTTQANYDSVNDCWFAEFSDDNWNYPNTRLVVERIGTTDASGLTVKFPVVSEKTINLKIRLPQIALPTVSLYNQDGITEKDNLIYRVSWTGLAGASELAELQEYEITVRYLDSNDEMQQLLFLTGDSLNQVTDVLNTDDPVIFASDSTATSAVINLNSLGSQAGSDIQVSLRAIARDGAETYRNSLDGVARTTTLYQRLATPVAENLTYAADALMSVDAFTATGVNFTMAQSYQEYGNYQMSAEIVKPDETGDYVHVADLTDGAGAVISHSNPLEFSGNLTSGTLNLTGISAEYAGLWLKVSLRAVSDSAISSTWSDNDSSVTDYAYFQLPAVRVDTPSVTTGTVQYTYTHDSPDEVDWDRLNQNSISFRDVDYAGGYLLNLVETLQDVDINDQEDHKQSQVHYLRLERVETGFEVFYCSTNDEVYGVGTEVDLGLLEAGDTSDLELPYFVTTGAAGDTIDLHAHLKLKTVGNSTTVTLVLPDCSTEQITATQSVTVQALAADAQRYADSYLAVWNRTAAGITTQALIQEVLAPEIAPELFTVFTSDRDGISYELAATTTYRMVLKLSYEDPNAPDTTVTRLYAVPGVADSPTLVRSLLLLPTDVWAALDGQPVSVSVQYLMDGQGATPWSEPVTVQLTGITQTQTLSRTGASAQFDPAHPSDALVLDVGDGVLNLAVSVSDADGSVHFSLPGSETVYAVPQSLDLAAALDGTGAEYAVFQYYRLSVVTGGSGMVQFTLTVK